ncbi:MAG: TlpA family protein disulfide reductase [Flavobacteriales bacterium]|nr:TlpA family protein disulfide reductase [Flavobacteriia bacterium]NCP05814.1 TlpA family protein disulfide reductase [Flavobacteriales bacterium]PIV94383.1 MAG: TlpA family protein disulfide reductase [Flavobacteriaceae bacterium CG17_big_fil_post_rev_8_21_14_2_50_33_15]PIY09206.1 MAG: TlpA family protein disulfide reductase [Flavobacteriaceae bacterium CG_4_10_14_3_um_filter_33_47]PJB19499.1 MAG: TlpA family protein disulfide reductase [Flavobacteriaceae bacterium CG_4_9_14_3_um_filter_33_1
MLKRVIFLVFLLPSFLFSQHTIKGTFTNAKDYKYALLYKILPLSTSYIGNAEINADGTFLLNLDESVSAGMYKIVYAMPKEDYNFDVIYNAKEDIEFTFDAEKGITYQESIENKLVTGYTSSMSMISQSIGNFFRQQSKDTLALMAIFKTQRETQKSFEEAAKGTIALEFIKANEPYIPETVEDLETYINNLEIHFFDHVDFNNITLQSSDFLVERMYNYVLGMGKDTPDISANYKKNIDDFCLAMNNAPLTIKSSLLLQLWQSMADSDFESVANYITDTYLINVAKALNDQVLIDGLIQFKNTSKESKAPDFYLDNPKNQKKLSDLNGSEYYVLVFWSSSCSHCLNEIPQLRAFKETLKEGKLKVVAIGLEDDDKNWTVKIKEFPDFIHVLGLGKWDNEIGNMYDIKATPTYFVLDKNKRIVAKPKDIEALKSFFN